MGEAGVVLLLLSIRMVTGLTDSDETNIHKTNPNNPDTAGAERCERGLF